MRTAAERIHQLNQGYGAADVHLPRRAETKQQAESKPGYYDVPMLKRSPWKWEISSYFFFGGLSAGAFLLSRLSERFGGRETQQVTRLGSAVAAISVLPCAPLLIKDLGDMSRFHHMLRVFKPESPMSLGTWTLTTYSGAAAIALLRELLRNDELKPAARGRLAAAMHRSNPVLIAAIDGAGIPAALLMTSYTGVLLSCTATPIWTRNAWISPLFVASAMNTAAAAVQLAMACSKAGPDGASERVLQKVSAVARVGEAITLSGYLQSLGDLAAPLTRGKQVHHTWLAYAALIAPEVIQHALPHRFSRWKLALTAGITLLGGLSLRQGIVNAGNESADDPQAARRVSGPQEPRLSTERRYL